MIIKHNETEYYKTVEATTTDIKSALKQLNDKLNNVTRDVSFWDVYNITQVLQKDSDVYSKLPLLNIGEGAIVNVNYISYNSESHYRGDIAYKKSDGEIIWISAENKGVYSPTLTLDNNNLVLNFAYTTTPEQSIIASINTQVRNAYLQDFHFSSGSSLQPFTVTFSAVFIDSTNILKPIIKFFVQEKNNFNTEDFYLDWHWRRDNNNIVVTIDDYPSADFFTKHDLYMRVR